MLRPKTCSLALICFSCVLAASQTQYASNSQPAAPADDSAAPAPPKVDTVELEKRPSMNPSTRMLILQAMNAEFARTRKYIPLASKNITLTPEGKVEPGDAYLYQMCQTHGAAAKVGDRIQITNIVLHEKSIYIEVNGGPKKKSHWYQHVTIMGGSGEVTPGSGDPNAEATGAAVSLEFKKHVPELTGPELKQLLDPIFDFSVKTATDVYLENVPPKVKKAIKNHEVLVGMNHDMVVMAKDRPPQKVREKDAKGIEYEEWIYGALPQDVTFVRFVGDEVTEVKVMKVGGDQILKTEKEVDVRDGVVSLAAATAQGISTASGENQAPQQSGPRPTLKRPGEDSDPSTQSSGGPMPRGRPADPTDPANLPPNAPPPMQVPAPGSQPPN